MGKCKFFFYIVFSIFLLSPTAVFAQDTLKNLPPLDKSPMDAAYFPANYPIQKLKEKVSATPDIKLIYSRPQLNERIMFGDKLPYAQVWRLGANEATEIEFFKDVTIGGKKIKKGEYSIYAIPDSSQWTIIVNTETDIWGSFKYDEKKDVARVTVPVTPIANTIESFTIFFEESTNGCSMVTAWEHLMVKLPIQF